MKKKRILWLIMLAGGISLAWYGYYQYTRTNPDVSSLKPAFTLDAKTLVAEFEREDSLAGLKYNGKTIQVSGPVLDPEKDEKGSYTLVLSEGQASGSVRCSMDSNHMKNLEGLSNGMNITVRGICTGFNRDEMGLGSDVILNRCVLIQHLK